MAIAIYREISSGVYTAYSQYFKGAPVAENAITTTHDGTLGDVQELKLFIRNNDATKYYTHITMFSESITDPDDTVGIKSGWGIKLRYGVNQPTEAQWEAIDYSNEITFQNLGASGSADTITYLPFWYRIECPAGLLAQNKDNILLVLDYTESAV